MREIIEFTAFGNIYRHKQYAATKGISLLDKLDKTSPLEILSDFEILNKKWEKISAKNIDELVKDKASVISPLEVLRVIVAQIAEINLGFIKDWKCLRVPSRFNIDAPVINIKNVDPLITTLIQTQSATLKELETYYSTKDAFDMFDIAMAKGINEALANEAIMNKKK